MLTKGIRNWKSLLHPPLTVTAVGDANRFSIYPLKRYFGAASGGFTLIFNLPSKMLFFGASGGFTLICNLPYYSMFFFTDFRFTLPWNLWFSIYLCNLCCLFTFLKLMIFDLPLRLVNFSLLLRLVIFNLPLWELWFSIYLSGTYDFRFQFTSETCDFQFTSLRIVIFNLSLWDLRFSIYLSETCVFQFTSEISEFRKVNWKS